jgi:hypothetical protein
MTAPEPTRSRNAVTLGAHRCAGGRVNAAMMAAAVGLMLAGCGAAVSHAGPTPTLAAGTRTSSPSPSSVTGSGAASPSASVTAGSVIDETIGGASYQFQVGQSATGSKSVINAFDQQVEPSGQADFAPSGSSSNFVAVVILITNTGSTSVPALGEQTASGGNGFPLVAVADPAVMSTGTAGLTCPSANGPDFNADGGGKLCAEDFNELDGPWDSGGSSSPTELAPGATVRVVAAYNLPSGMSASQVHLAANVASFAADGIMVDWADSVPIVGSPITVSVTASPPA